MNSLIIFIIILFVLNILTFFLAKLKGVMWVFVGILFIVSAPFVLFITINVIGQKTGDGIAGGVAGFTFSGLLLINAIIFFIIAFFIKRNVNKKTLNT